MKCLASVLLAAVILGRAAEGYAQGFIVDHNSLPLFNQIPDTYLNAAAQIPMVFVNRSVGQNINDGLTCLGYASDAVAPNGCKRYIHYVPAFSSPQSEVQWSRAGGYNRANWRYFGWPGTGILPELPCGVDTGMWFNKLECFIRFVDQNPTQYRVYSYMDSYLEVDIGSDIASRTTGFFARQANRFDIGDFEAMEARHPTRIFLHHTSSLARAIGNQISTDYNNQMRDYARANNRILLDVADIESHDPWGRPCYDNRDGVPFTTESGSENNPDDGVNYPAVCQHYTRDTNGGHLGNPDVGKIRIAKAFWIVMARIAGWNPGSSGGGTTLPLAPTNLRVIPGQ